MLLSDYGNICQLFNPLNKEIDFSYNNEIALSTYSFQWSLNMSLTFYKLIALWLFLDLFVTKSLNHAFWGLEIKYLIFYKKKAALGVDGAYLLILSPFDIFLQTRYLKNNLTPEVDVESNLLDYL